MNIYEYPRAMEGRTRSQKLEQMHVRKIFSDWINSNKDGITIKKIRAYLIDKLDINIPPHQVRRYLKTVMKLSYKKRCIRRVDIDQNRLSYIRILYSIRIAKQMNENILMVNIDETSLNTEVLNQRSWLKIGVN